MVERRTPRSSLSALSVLRVFVAANTKAGGIESAVGPGAPGVQRSYDANSHRRRARAVDFGGWSCRDFAARWRIVGTSLVAPCLGSDAHRVNGGDAGPDAGPYRSGSFLQRKLIDESVRHYSWRFTRRPGHGCDWRVADRASAAVWSAAESSGSVSCSGRNQAGRQRLLPLRVAAEEPGPPERQTRRREWSACVRRRDWSWAIPAGDRGHKRRIDDPRRTSDRNEAFRDRRERSGIEHWQSRCAGSKGKETAPGADCWHQSARHFLGQESSWSGEDGAPFAVIPERWAANW